MEIPEKVHNRSKLSKDISEKIDLIAKLKDVLNKKKLCIGSSVDEQLSVAELEYKLVKEEMALMSLQEQHWESAALWDRTPDLQGEAALYAYVSSIRDKGGVAALHTTLLQPSPHNSVLVSSRGSDRLPRVEWAHPTTQLQAGDRILEAGGRVLVGADSAEVSRMLGAGGGCVILRPLPNRDREADNLRQELTTVVTRLNDAVASNSVLEKKCNDLKTQSRQMKLQVLTLQSILFYLHQGRPMLLKDGAPVYDFLKDIFSARKSLPWLELCPKTDEHEHGAILNPSNKF